MKGMETFWKVKDRGTVKRISAVPNPEIRVYRVGTGTRRPATWIELASLCQPESQISR
jgi:hypothetical protein